MNVWLCVLYTERTLFLVSYFIYFKNILFWLTVLAPFSSIKVHRSVRSKHPCHVAAFPGKPSHLLIDYVMRSVIPYSLSHTLRTYTLGGKGRQCQRKFWKLNQIWWVCKQWVRCMEINWTHCASKDLTLLTAQMRMRKGVIVAATGTTETPMSWEDLEDLEDRQEDHK